MKLLCLCKRRPQGRDLYTRPYGRFYHLPRLLAERGHEVHLLLLSYSGEPAAFRQEGRLHWHSVSALPWGPAPYLAKSVELIRRLRPDWLVGLSDTWYGILAQRLAAISGARSLIDAYDNYESYIRWAKPLHWTWRNACHRADALSAAGPGLLELIGGAQGPASKSVVPMAADPIFSRMARDDCRRCLGLPTGAALIGYCGSLYRNRGIENLFTAIEHLCREHPNLKFIVSGRRQKDVEFPSGVSKHMIDLGYLPDEQVPALLNAMDVLVVMNRPSDFGNHSYPVKLYEAMRCGIPVIATEAMGTRWILRDHPECLAPWDDPIKLVGSITRALMWGRKDYANIGNWEQSADIFTHLLESTSNGQLNS